MTLLSGSLGGGQADLPTTPPTCSAPDLDVFLAGQPRWAGQRLPLDEVATRLADAFRARGEAALASLQGPFALALLRRPTQELLLATDRFGIEPLYFCGDSQAIGYSSQLKLLAKGANLDPQALYNYVYFHCIPAPRTLYAGVSRLPAGHLLRWQPGRPAQLARYWQPDFAEPEAPADDRELQVQLRALMTQAVERASPTVGHVGAFLSGGLDSSSVVGTLAGLHKAPVATFSIGFDADGYDELPYARLVAAHFGTRSHERYVTPQDVLDSLPLLAAGYEQPFGNASAIPAYQCARLAREHGVDTLLAGDGGDEIFGGNARYAKQGRFERYGRLPGWVRGIIEPLTVPLANRAPALGKLGSYVKQARIPLPGRLQSYNQVERLGPLNLFGADFLATIDSGEPLRALQAEYAAAPAQHYVNRLLALDGKFTLADNDLPKVVGTAALAGVSVAFPMLDEDLVAFGYRLSIRQKVDGAALRPLFRNAMRGVLPDQTLGKSKHGFGLPFGVWLGSHAGLQELADASLRALAGRGWFEATFLARLRDELHRSHLAYWGELVWVLVMLEQWLQHHKADASAGGGC